MRYWGVVVSDGFFRVASNFEQIGEACVSDIMAKSTEDNGEHLKWSEYLLSFDCVW